MQFSCAGKSAAATRTTLNNDDLLLDEARRITGVTKKTALVREGTEVIDRTRERTPAGAAGRQRATTATEIPRWQSNPA